MAKAGGTDPPVGPMSPTGSVLWALLPLLTIGLGTVFVLGWAAHRLRSRNLALCTALALVVTVVALVLTDEPQGSAANGAGGALIAVGLVGGGLAATFTVRGRLVRPGHADWPGYPGAPGNPDPVDAVRWSPGTGRPSAQTAVDPVIGEALARRQRRLQARGVLERDPALARELRIGRPDLPRRFDDGGLVDVNHVPAEVLAGLPGVSAELAERVVRVRDTRDGLGFAFAEELTAYAGFPEDLAAELAERLLYLR